MLKVPSTLIILLISHQSCGSGIEALILLPFGGKLLSLRVDMLQLAANVGNSAMVVMTSWIK